MKTPEEWASLYFSDKVRFLSDLIKQVQDEAKSEILEVIQKSINVLTIKPEDKTFGQ